MEVDFIVVDAYSPYIAIVSRPWLHTLGDQTMARQCMVTAIRHRLEAEPVTLSEKEL